MFFRLPKESCKDLKDKKICYSLYKKIDNGFNKFCEVINLKDLQIAIRIKKTAVKKIQNFYFKKTFQMERKKVIDGIKQLIELQLILPQQYEFSF